MKAETSMEPYLHFLHTSPGLPPTGALKQGRPYLKPWNLAPSLPHTYQLLSWQDPASIHLVKA